MKEQVIVLAFTWTENLATGNTLIDTQHKQLVKATNDLIDACKSGQGKTQLDSTMQFLIDYTHKRFGDEEKLQQQYSYPDYQNHKKLHDAFKSSIEDLAKKLKVEGPTPSLTAKITSAIGEWLVKHILNDDKKVAAHIHN